MTTPPPPLLFETDAESGVAVITLNRPHRLNAFTRPMIDEWCEALREVARTPSIHAVVLTGAGRAFCAGGDAEELESFMKMDALGRKEFLWSHVHQIALLMEVIDRPVIAAINGTARGAGLDMALMCDLRIMDADAVVAQSYIDMGVMPGDGGAFFLPRLVGPAVALELMWTGDEVDAETALRMGMVNRIAPAGQAFETAHALARRIAAQPTEAIKFTKRSVYQALQGMPLRTHLDAVSSHMAVLQELPPFRDKVTAFLERSRRKSKT